MDLRIITGGRGGGQQPRAADCPIVRFKVWILAGVRFHPLPPRTSGPVLRLARHRPHQPLETILVPSINRDMMGREAQLDRPPFGSDISV
jgi:hypothetical protein